MALIYLWSLFPVMVWLKSIRGPKVAILKLAQTLRLAFIPQVPQAIFHIS